MCSEFNLHDFPEHSPLPVSVDAEVVNPERRELEESVRQQRSMMAQMRNGLAREKDSNGQRARELRAAISSHKRSIETLCARRPEVPRRVLAGSLEAEQRLDALSRPTRALLDAVRMIVYRAQTALPSAARVLGQRGESERCALRGLFRTDASLRPDAAGETLTVKFLRFADPAHDWALEPLFKQLNETDLRLIRDWLS